MKCYNLSPLSVLECNDLKLVHRPGYVRRVGKLQKSLQGGVNKLTFFYKKKEKLDVNITPLNPKGCAKGGVKFF